MNERTSSVLVIGTSTLLLVWMFVSVASNQVAEHPTDPDAITAAPVADDAVTTESASTDDWLWWSDTSHYSVSTSSELPEYEGRAVLNFLSENILFEVECIQEKFGEWRCGEVVHEIPVDWSTKDDYK